jgi:hypothetical protein
MRPNGNQAVRRCKSSCPTLWVTVRFPLQSSQMPDGHLVSLFSADFSVLHCNDSIRRGVTGKRAARTALKFRMIGKG